MFLDNYFKRQTTLENEIIGQLQLLKQTLLTSRKQVHDAQQNACKKQQLSTKNKTR